VEEDHGRDAEIEAITSLLVHSDYAGFNLSLLSSIGEVIFCLKDDAGKGSKKILDAGLDRTDVPEIGTVKSGPISRQTQSR